MKDRLKKIDAAVIGGGPAGLITAAEIASREVQVEVFEEHPRIGEPKHCAGLVSIEGFRRLGIQPSREFVQNTISGGVLYSPKRVSIELESSRPRAYVIDRPAFDRYLAAKAEKLGVKINFSSRVEALIRGEECITVQTSKKRAYADLVVNAGGAETIFKLRNRISSDRGLTLTGVNTEIEGCCVEEDKVEVWFGRDLAPGLFAWVIPLSRDRVRCGLGCEEGNPVEKLEKFILKRFGQHKPLQIWGGTILLSGPVRKTYDEGLILVGDAAGQTKSTTGGGIILGGLCAIEAGRVAAEAVEAGDASEKFLARYQSAWRKKYGRDFSRMVSVRKLVNNLTDDQLDQIFRVIKDENMEDVLRGVIEEGDMDLQSKVITSVLTNPAFLRILLKVSRQTLHGRLRRILNL
ncbi:MAG: NAD(P)/FAD-dependent oxidoreductase [Candidatus Bathyarchaeia archaeon]